MIISRQSKFILLLIASLVLSGCIFGSSDRRSSSSEDDPSENPVVPDEDHRDTDEVFAETTLHIFRTPTIIDEEDNVDDDEISAFIVNYDLPVVNTTDDEVNNDDEDDLIFDLDSNDWNENTQSWKDNQTAPNEDATASIGRDYQILDRSGWQEVLSSDRTEYHFIDEEYIREFHLGVEREWAFPDIEIDFLIEGETEKFYGKIDGRKISDWTAWLQSLGFPEDATDFEWAVDNEYVDDDEFSDGAEVIAVRKWIVETRYQVEQNILSGNILEGNAHYEYEPINDNISNLASLDTETGVYTDTKQGLSLAMEFSFGSAIPACNPSNSNPVGSVDISTGFVQENADLIPDCVGSTTVLILELTSLQKDSLGINKAFDLFLADIEIDGETLIYVGKRYNKTTKSNQDTYDVEVFYNDIAIQDIRNSFKSWRDQDHEDNGDD